MEVLGLAKHYFAKLGIATVYRNIRLLLEERWLIAVEIPGAHTRYEVSGKSPHGYFYCTMCQKLYALSSCEMPTSVKLPSGCTITNHMLVVYGRCDSCR